MKYTEVSIIFHQVSIISLTPTDSNNMWWGIKSKKKKKKKKKNEKTLLNDLKQGCINLVRYCEH